MLLRLIDSQYELKVSLYGTCTSINKCKEKYTRGIESLPADFELLKNYVEEESSNN